MRRMSKVNPHGVKNARRRSFLYLSNIDGYPTRLNSWIKRSRSGRTLPGILATQVRETYPEPSSLWEIECSTIRVDFLSGS
jgi:hypothetical protein